jgi:hypothetical protein
MSRSGSLLGESRLESNEMNRSYFGVKSTSILLYATFCCITLAIVGILLSSLSTVVAVPYTTEEEYNYVRLDYHFNDTLTIGPNSSQTYPWYTWLWLNRSLVQISLTSSGKLNVSLYKNLEFPDIHWPPELLWQDHLGEGFRYPGQYGNYWCIFYWVPPGPQGYDVRSPGYSAPRLFSAMDFDFVFTNPESFANTISFQVKVYYPTAIGRREVTNYRPTIDPQFFYAGISLVAVAVAFESALQVKSAISQRKE